MSGGRGHPRNISRGIKRTAGFYNSNGAAGAGRTQSPDAKDTRVLNSRKKAKTDDADAKLLWSPGKKAEDRGGAGSHNLSSLASSFKERYGEELALCEDEPDESGHSETASSEQPPSSRRTNGLGGGGMEAVEETARSMSPAKLAVEVQKAKARAREERFGGGAKASSNVARASSIGKPAIQLAVSLTEIPADVRRQLSDASGGEVENGEGTKPSQARVAAPVQIINPIQEAAAAPSIAVSASTKKSSSSKKSSSLTGKVGSRAESARTISAPPAELSAAASIPEKTIDAPQLPIVHAIDAEEDEADESGAEAAVSTEDVIFSRETPSMTVASKRDAPHEGDIAAFEPAAKKMTTALAKVLTLRLRLRSDVANGAADSNPDAGVEESKGFEPPNPPEDSGVEECKGFDPPNLPPTPAPESRVGPIFPEAIMVSSDSIVEPKDPPAPSVACSSSVSPAVETGAPATTSGINSYTPGERAPTPVLIRQNSWGPSFGIFQETETATAAPVNPAAAPSNPWIISPDAPTFARNQGRPLARSFPPPTAREKAVPVDEKEMERAASSQRERATRSGSMACCESDRNGGSVAVPAGGAYKGDGIALRRAPYSNDTALSRPLNRTRPRAAMSIDARDRTREDPEVQASQPRMLAAWAHAPGSKGDDSGGVGTEATNPHGPGQGLELPFDGGAGKLLEKLKREREESLEFERKLTKALLDL